VKPDAAQRTWGALKLYRQHYAPVIVSAGGDPQARIQENLLLEAGVPREVIIVETSPTTHSSAMGLSQIMVQRGWRSVVVVTSQMDVPRRRGVFRKLGVQASFFRSPNFTPPNTSISSAIPPSTSPTTQPTNTWACWFINGRVTSDMAGDLSIPQPILDYLHRNSIREPEVLRRLREETARHPRANMQIPQEHGQFMAWLVELLGATKTIEIGVFTGYSSLWVALALPPEGRIVACDVNEEFMYVARRYWKEAGVDHKIDLRLQPALKTLRELLAKGEHGKFDFAFIDADKPNYENYYECCLDLLRPGGVVMADNVLWSGRVADASNQEPDTIALRAFNMKLFKDERVSLSMLPLGDGVTLARKR